VVSTLTNASNSVGCGLKLDGENLLLVDIAASWQVNHPKAQN
jgi:hypothetical protein